MRKPVRSALSVMVALALAATACGGDDDATTGDAPPTGTSAPDDGSPRNVTVNVDGEVGSRNVALLAYFPREVTVRQGDTVSFAFQPGDPHTVSFGALVDSAFAAFAAGEEDPADGAKIPGTFSDAGDALIYGGALPCYADDPPVDGPPCEPVDQPAFDGTLGWYNSGLLEPGGTFTVEIAADAAPGTYNYFCGLHGPDMSGSVTVVAADGEGQTAADVDAAREAELAAVAGAADGLLTAHATGVHAGLEGVLPTGPNYVVGGGFQPEPVPIDLLEFGPADVTVAAGESVTWNMVGFHTLSFNATQDATPAIMPGADGLPVLNPLAFAPQGGAPGMPPPPEGEPPAEGEGEGPPPPPTVLDGGSWDGAGFFSTGVLPSFPPALVAYELTFTTAGTYAYVCLVHPGMEGTVTVT